MAVIEIVHTLLEGETLQSVAFRYYGDSGLWADIADANNIIDPFTEVYRGKQLIIPNS
jgi:nucleoid-associated protein YgaU